MTAARTSAGLAVVVALMTVGIAGCTGGTTDQPTQTPTASASPTATPSVDPDDPQAVAYATATALFEEYFELSQEIRQKPGVPDWEIVLNYTSGDIRTNTVFVYEAMAADGVVQEGEARIASIVPISYESDPTGWADVVLAVCIDSSESSMAGWVGGPSKSKPGQPDRVLLTYTVRAFPQTHLGGDVVSWAIDSAEILEEQAC
ncbi:MAG: hypothetical protein FWH11_05175 [Micrococcales bacterium]|nr:hypothetical protein [Micrococcales bacterium]